MGTDNAIFVSIIKFHNPSFVFTFTLKEVVLLP